MTCCTYPRPHRHYDQWIRETVIIVPCRYRHPSHTRAWRVNDLLRAWNVGR